MIVGEAELALRQEHAVRFDAADDALLEVDAGAGNVGAGRREDADHAGPGVRRAADDLDIRAVAGIDDADAETIGIRMRLGRDHPGDAEGREIPGQVLDALDLEADHGQPLGDAVDGGDGVEVLFQPGQGEFHVSAPSVVRAAAMASRRARTWA